MILFTILLLTIIVVAAVVLMVTGVVGTATIAVFGDVIVFALLVGLIIKCLIKKKK